tara:strand:+ start:236 stop:361 length:126 start_codon:yes stop_codon:yes gene_type:complete
LKSSLINKVVSEFYKGNYIFTITQDSKGKILHIDLEETINE